MNLHVISLSSRQRLSSRFFDGFSEIPQAERPSLKKLENLRHKDRIKAIIFKR